MTTGITDSAPASPVQMLPAAYITPDRVQAAVEGVPDRSRMVELKGAWFRIADKVGLMPLIRFAHAAGEDLSTADMEGLAALYDMLRDSIHEGTPCTCGAGDEPGGEHLDGCTFDAGDWKKFERHATRTKAEADDLLPVIQQVIEKVSARPTQPPGGSSSGRPPTSGSLTASSFSAPAAASST